MPSMDTRALLSEREEMTGLYCASLPGAINLFQLILTSIILGIMTHQDLYSHQLVHFRWELWTLLMCGLSLALTLCACLLLAVPKLNLLKTPTLRMSMVMFALVLGGWLVAGGLEAWYAMRLKELLDPRMRVLDLRQPHELVPLYQRYHVRALLSGLSFGNALLYAGSLVVVPNHISQQTTTYQLPNYRKVPRTTVI